MGGDYLGIAAANRPYLAVATKSKQTSLNKAKEHTQDEITIKGGKRKAIYSISEGEIGLTSPVDSKQSTLVDYTTIKDYTETDSFWFVAVCGFNGRYGIRQHF